VLSGVRGCGKTTLLAMYIDWLKRTGVDDQQIIFVSMEDPESETLPHYQGLYSHIKKRLRRDRLTYVFIDEIQLCADYEKAIDGLLINRQADLYVSISNACAFSNAPHTEIRVLPLSFAERLIFSRVKIPGRAEELQAFSLPDRPGQAAAAQVPAQLAAQTERRLPRQRAQMEKYLQREAFNEYLSFGGFPFAAALGGDASLTRHYVDGIYSAILVKDVARQAGINDIPLLALVAKVMGQNAGRPLSSKKVGSAISAKGRKISCNTVETYMQALTTAFAFYHAERFDIKTGKRLKTLGKYYAADTGMLNLSLESPDLDGQLENVVYLELLRRGFQVCVGKHDRDEVNFAAFGQPPASGAAHDNAQGNDGKTYFQVAPSVRDRAVLAGKLSPLERIRDNHPKYILSLDETPFRANYDGIVQKNLVDWLLEK
jgi:predicted AAA+ superfamily ATPase